MSKTYPKQTLDYDVSGLDENFESVPFAGDSALIVQIFHENINKDDGEMILQHSLTGKPDEFADYEDSSGAVVKVVIIGTTTKFSMLSVYGFTAKYIRFRYNSVTAAIGTITNIDFLMQ